MAKNIMLDLGVVFLMALTAISTVIWIQFGISKQLGNLKMENGKLKPNNSERPKIIKDSLDKDTNNLGSLVSKGKK